MPGVDLAASQAYCRRVARRSRSNFYYAFLPLSREQRDAMCAVYAFARHADDLSDDSGPGAADGSGQALRAWRSAAEAALAGACDAHPILPALHHAAGRFRIPSHYLWELIDGVASDLNSSRFETFDDLYRYCYQVASTVGLVCLHIFGFCSSEALPLGEKLGVAFQLTNILRDLREDAARGRVYLPEQDLERFQVTRGDLEAGRVDRLRELLRFQADRAEQHYQQAAPLLDLVHPRSRASLWIMTAVYHRLLERVRASGYDVFSRRAGLSRPEKIGILLQGLKLHWMGGTAPFPA